MTKEENIEGLAAEYVLGSLDEAERKEVNVRRRTDTPSARAIKALERQLGPLSEDAPSVEPPSNLLNGILARIPERRRSIRSAEVVPACGCKVLAVASDWCYRARCISDVGGWLAPAPQVTGMYCNRLYKEFWAEFSRERLANNPAKQLAGSTSTR